MRKARDTVSVDDHAGRHARYFESLSEGALRIELNSEAGMESLQELLGVGPIVIKADGNHSQTLVLVGILHCLHPRKGLPAGRAPGCPEVQIDDLPSTTV